MARTRREGALNGLAEASDMVYQPDLWGAGLKTLAMLCIVLGILILVLFLLKRLSYLKQGSGHGQLIRVLSSYHMTPKERIALIDVAGQKMVRLTNLKSWSGLKGRSPLVERVAFSASS